MSGCVCACQQETGLPENFGLNEGQVLRKPGKHNDEAITGSGKPKSHSRKKTATVHSVAQLLLTNADTPMDTLNTDLPQL